MGIYNYFSIFVTNYIANNRLLPLMLLMLHKFTLFSAFALQYADFRIFLKRNCGYYFLFLNILYGFYLRAAAIFLHEHFRLEFGASGHSNLSTISDKKVKQ